ncbi:MAG TPA: asparagine synthase-related protein, partial [Vicinamibacterales bacterium]
MPGIVGLLTAMPRARAKAELLRMVQALGHEPFYRSGTWSDESLGVYVGWAVPKNSFSDGMPLWNERCDIGLVFSGEEFPASATIRGLPWRQHEMAPDRPSYLVHLADEDRSFPAGLNGTFHGLLIDRRRGTATLFNDRYGLQRVYIHGGKEAFYFSAEAKAILAVRPELRRVDPRGLGEFVACGCVLENRTLFERIDALPPAAAWVFREGSLERKRAYFEAREWEEQTVLDSESYYRELRDTFSQRLPRYFNGRQRIGMSLTGGMDTRMIVAWHKAPPASLPCYSFGGMFRDSQDVVLARRVAEVCGQPYEVIPVGDGFLSRFAHYAERSVYLTDGCTGAAHAPDLYLNERAREIAPVRMTGNYGGEVLRQVRAFKPVAPSPDLYRPELLSHVRRASDTYATLLGGHPLSFSVFRQAPWHHYGLRALEQTQVSMRTPFLDNEFVRTVFRAPASVRGNHDASLRLIADGDAALLGIRTDRGVTAQSRFPAAIQRRLLEFTFKAEYAYDHGMPQSVARIDHLLSPLRLERLFLGRHKFAHFRVWYRDVLSGYVRDMLLDSRT